MAFCWDLLLPVRTVREHLQSKFTNISVEYNAEFFGSISAWLTPQGYLNLDINLNRTIKPGMRTTITLLQRVEGGSESKRFQTLFSYDMDICRTLKELLQASLMKVWLRNVFKYGHFATRCPIKPAFYDLRNFQMENHSIPGYLRPGFYRVHDTNYYRRPRGGQRRLVATFTLDIKFY
ncbi:uncharacterized protein LOC111076817 isoform X2 [Drosophila obscura]|uniref:uncharacterized protein LOC111076817 isoform X2 n=1 Tax=Drosophila obscura TaxID=7282 RepID=UPI001BB1722E|nr:uncharacterized protein LOC111076817 isoform X2 [Drosophila obscura]